MIISFGSLPIIHHLLLLSLAATVPWSLLVFGCGYAALSAVAAAALAALALASSCRRWRHASAAAPLWLRLQHHYAEQAARLRSTGVSEVVSLLALSI